LKENALPVDLDISDDHIEGRNYFTSVQLQAKKSASAA